MPTNILSQDDEQFDPQNLSMYVHMDKYNAKTSFENVESSCKGFVCKESGVSEISTVLLLDKENTMRNTLAGVEKLSNMYSVKWNSDFARMAREKVMLCLPPTTIDQTIYDTKMLQELPYFRELNDSRTAKAVEVVIGSKVKEIGNQDVKNVYDYMKNEMTDFLSEKHFNHRDALFRRGSTLYMGCDYLVRNNATHVLGNMVCVYGLLYFIDRYHNDYKPLRGKTCSECSQFYDRHPAFTTNVNLSRKWACELLYPYLCKDTFDESKTTESSNLYPCDGAPPAPTTSKITFVFITAQPDTEYSYTPQPAYKWPCYQYSVPIILITFIIFVIIIYNIGTILSLRANYENKGNN